MDYRKECILKAKHDKMNKQIKNNQRKYIQVLIKKKKYL